MKFWDSSAIVPLVVEEKSSSWAMKLYDADPIMLVWWGTEVECVSALVRLERQRAASTSDLATALQRMAALKSSWQEIQAVEVVRETAVRMLRVHELRAADSLQLSAAIIASQYRPSSLEFVSLDERLKSAARREGFALVEYSPS